MTAWAFLKAHIWIVPIVVVPLLLLILRAVLRRRRRRLDEEEMSQLKRRDEALSDALRNPLAGPVQRQGGEDAMEIVWDEKAVTKERGKAALMAELVERSGYSQRKYVFRIEDPIGIGSAPDVRLSIPREGIEKRHCEIFMSGTRPCVRSATGAKTILRRGRRSVLVGQEGVYLRNGDHIQAGSADIQFRLFRA